MPDRSPPSRVGFNALLLSVDQGYRAAGIHTYIVSLLAAMAAIDGPSVVAFVPRPCADDVLPPAVETWRAPACTARPFWRVLWEQAAMPAALAFAGTQLYHGAAYAMPAAARCPAVVTVHDLSPFRHPDGFPRAQAFYLRAAMRHAARRAEALIAVSHFTAAELRSVLGVPSARVHVVPNGVDERFGRHAGEALERHSGEECARFRARLGLPSTYVLTVGTLQPRKNLGMLLEAYARVRAVRADAPPLVVAGGSGWGNDDLADLADRFGIADRVRWLGYVPDGDLAALYACATVFACPSRYEGFGLPVLEAMASGVPSVVATGSSLTEVGADAAVHVAHDDPGAWAAALEALLAEPARRARLSAAGRERARAYTWSRAAHETMGVYRAVLAESAEPRHESAARG